jgi:hypothetical protein
MKLIGEGPSWRLAYLPMTIDGLHRGRERPDFIGHRIGPVGGS